MPLELATRHEGAQGVRGRLLLTRPKLGFADEVSASAQAPPLEVRQLRQADRAARAHGAHRFQLRRRVEDEIANRFFAPAQHDGVAPQAVPSMPNLNDLR